MHSSLPNFVFVSMGKIDTAAVCRYALAACTYQGRIQRVSLVGDMASAGARAYSGSLGAEPQQGPGAEPLIRGSGAKPP